MRAAVVDIWKRVFVNWKDTLKMGVPALCYCFQNYLFFVAISNMPATSYQLWSQSKTLTTALFFVLYIVPAYSPRPAARSTTTPSDSRKSIVNLSRRGPVLSA